MTLQQRALTGLAQAARALSGRLDLEEVLQTILHVAADVTGARYAALGVLGDDRRIARFLTLGVDDDTIRAIGDLPEGHGLLGLLIDEPQIIRLDDLTQHPASSGFPPHHPPMTTFLGAPVLSGGKVYGNLYLTEKEGGFTAADEDLVEVLAAQAGTAVSNALLAEQLQALAVQDERNRISRDLHDGVIQSLYSIGMGLESVRSRVHSDPDRVAERLDAAVEGLDGAIRELRGYIFQLRPQDAAAFGLSGGLVELAREYEVNALVRPDVEVEPGLEDAVDERLVVEALQVVREALTNAAKHASAGAVTVTARTAGEGVAVAVTDDGRGFDPAHTRVGHGLDNLQARAATVGGTLVVSSTPGEGTTVRLWLPLTIPDKEGERP